MTNKTFDMTDGHSMPINERGADPDPVAILTICFAGVGMLSGVAATIMQFAETRRRRREERREEREALAEARIAADRLILVGHTLIGGIDSLERNASVALSFARRESSAEGKKTTFSFGSNPISVSGASLEMWNLLVDDVCNNIRLINRFVLEYNQHIGVLFEKVRLLQASSPSLEHEIERLLHYGLSQADSLNRQLARFQSLTAKTPLPRALAVFNDVCREARYLVGRMESLADELLYRRLR